MCLIILAMSDLLVCHKSLLSSYSSISLQSLLGVQEYLVLSIMGVKYVLDGVVQRPGLVNHLL